MEIGINRAAPLVMHIDLNSAFAMIEQQANPLLRNHPLAMANRLSQGATIIAASYEAKTQQVGVGTKVAEGKQLIPDLRVLETDPAKYIHAHRIFSKIITSYSPDAYMKSIDEGIVDFTNIYSPPTVNELIKVGKKIKRRLKDELGEWVTCNVGIATNRWLAKLAASLHKPDGLDVITHHNLIEIYRQLKLTDLFGINRRYERRLKAAGINTPLDLFRASEQFLRRQVFKSIVGHYWYLRLRGWEVDATQFGTKSIGRQYVLHEWTHSNQHLAPILMKLCEGMGRRMRAKDLCAQGIYLNCWYLDPPAGGGGWHTRKKFKVALYSTIDLYTRAWQLLQTRPPGTIKTLAVSCYGLVPAKHAQLNLFPTRQSQWELTQAIDELNNRYGEFVVRPGLMIGTDEFVKEKIPFGTIKHLPK